MMISTKNRYALRFLVDGAEHQGDGFVPLRDVAVRQAGAFLWGACLPDSLLFSNPGQMPVEIFKQMAII